MEELISELRAALINIVDKYEGALPIQKLTPGIDYLPPTGKVVGKEEFSALLQASADMWLTAGRFCEQFEKEFAAFWGLKKSLLVNSGSSANLLALASLTSPNLGESALKRGDEIITPACAFPTTLAPAIQYGLKPVFIDVDLATHNATIESIRAAVGPNTKAVMLAHALGNPFRADLVAELCDEKGLWFIEDCCDALGATINGEAVGTFGDFATCSFYPAHHMTMGEGGAVLTDDANLYRIAMSMRDWGRDCWCPPGVTNSCKRRFNWQMGELPQGYDHKYTYSHIGYNLKSTDFQGAMGLAQLAKVKHFIQRRRDNHAFLTRALKEKGLDEFFVLPEPTPNTDPSWFGFILVIREKGLRPKIIQHLENKGVGTRLLFAGNIMKQPAFVGIDYRQAERLTNTDKLMEDGFWVGIWPGLEEAHLAYIAAQLKDAVDATVHRENSVEISALKEAS